MGRPRVRANTGARPGGASTPPSRRRTFTSPFSIALLLSLLPLSSPALGAQSSEDLRRAAHRLRAVQSSLEPLPDSAINRDAGDIAIVEHDGTNYDDRLPDGTPNVEARARVGLRFYETHPDAYDFLVVFTNFEFKTSDATAFHMYGRNDVEGIGKPVGSIGPVVFGSPSRLKGWIDMAAVSQYRKAPFALEPGPGFLRTLGVVAHEVGHQWLAEARYKVGETVFDDLLGADERHWSYLLDSDASFLYGADWRDAGNGTFAADRVLESYSALDLYLMGLLPREKVAPLTLLRNPEIDRHRINREGEVVSATGATTITIDQVVDAMGARRPDHLHSQKELRLGFVFLAAPGTDPSPEDLEAVERVRRAFGAHFFALTHGVGWADTSLTAPPPAPRATTLDLPRALAWLGAQQALDGSWADAPQTRERDTSAAVFALLRAKAALPAAQRGIAWLRAAQPESLDFQARVATALEPLALAASERAARLARVLGGQNPDGGFGAGRDFASDALDTALALRALKALQQPPDARVSSGVAALAALANADGGWAAIPGAETSTVVTAEVLLALQDWADAPGSAALRAQGTAALVSRRNPDGGFGSSPSNPHASALALDVLLRSGARPELVDPLTTWLQQAQLADGSWASSPYQTALVIGALGQSLGPNLVVPTDALAVSPSPAREGEVVRVTARVRNVGRVAAPATVARLHDGDPASTAAIGESAVPPLVPGEDAEVAFDLATVDRAGPHTLYVVADASGLVRESREDDNAASRALTVEGLLADLEVLPADVVVAPAVPQTDETAVVSVTVRNRGERASGACAVAFSFTDALGRTSSPGVAVLPPLGPGEAGTVSVTWTPEDEGEFLVQARADARFEVAESDETNGTATRPARVVARAPDEADLAPLEPTLAPAALEELPQAVEVRVLVQNAGRSPAATSVVVYDPAEGPEPIASAPVSVPARSTVALAIPATVTVPGPRLLRVRVDPDDAIPEADESDNDVEVGLGDARTNELEVVAATQSAAEVRVGETLTVTAEVRNRGTLDVPSIPVQLARDSGAGPEELARASVGVPAGASRVVTLDWIPVTPEEDAPLVVRVDPFDLLHERREDDNARPLRLRVRASGLPNLVVTGAEVGVTPDPPLEGQAAAVTAVVRNTGESASGAFVVRFFTGDPDAGGVSLGEAPVASVEPGGARAVTLDWTPAGLRGSVGLFVVADVLQEVEESLESDNRAFHPFSVIGFPDLVLAAADVALDPGYPRAGEAVTIRATVRNLGGQAGPATSLVVTERAGGVDTPVGAAAVPALPAGATAEVSLAWMPAAPPGPRSLSLVLDPDGSLVEQDEGNNSVRRTFVVQEADLYLTEPYFSPNGDGVKDETTLAWRSGGRVAVTLSDTSGRRARTLLTDGPPEGSVTWDGRDDEGVLMPDGPHTLTLSGADGRLLDRVTVVLDTNRSPIHDAEPGRTLVRNLTCALPEAVDDLAWLPGEDAVLATVRTTEEGFEPGLLRVGLDGSYEYLHRDPFYQSARLASDAAVSPDGRYALVNAGGALVRVDLATGARVPLEGDPWSTRWSPDSRFLSSWGRIATRDGAPVADLGALTGAWGEWTWSPASDRLALGNLVAARDGSGFASVPLPPEAEDPRPQWTSWLSDGRILTGLSWCAEVDRAPSARASGSQSRDESPGCEKAYVLDPESGTSEPMNWWPGWSASWSPRGDRVLTDGLLRRADGTALWRLLPWGSGVSPRASAAWFRKWAQSTEAPGRVCGDKQHDSFAVTSLANATADLHVTRLPANHGLLLRGTVSDANLDRFELDFARQSDPGTWYPIGPSSDAPAVDDELTPWVPPGPGTYVLRLRVHDRAGNTLTRARVVSWDRVPALANFTQTEYFLSPDGNGVKDDVRFGFLVLEPTPLAVRVVGPEPPGEGGPAPVERRNERLELVTLGPSSYTWDGRDTQGRVVPDGRYTVFLNELPFRVQVDATPPDIAFGFGNLRTVDGELSGPACRAFPSLNPEVDLGTIGADRSWHAVDPHLREWTFFTGGKGQPETGSAEVYDVETDAAGLPIVDPGGELRVRRVDGRPADRVDDQEGIPWLALSPGFRFEAEDHAGNRAEVAVPPLPEQIFPIGASYHCTPTLKQPVAAEGGTLPSGQPAVHVLAPGEIVLVAGASLNRAFADQVVRFAFQPREGGAWSDVLLPVQEPSGEWDLPVERFEDLGIDPIRTYRGRFLANGEAGEIASDAFLFRPCGEWLSAEIEYVPPKPTPYLVLRSESNEPIERAWARIGTGKGSYEVDLTPLGEGVFATYASPTCDPPLFSVHAVTTSGRLLPDERMGSSCFRIRQNWPIPPGCGGLTLEQEFPYCKGSPDQLHLKVAGAAPVGSRIDFELVGRAGPPLASVVTTEFSFGMTVVLDVTGEPEGGLPVRAWVTPPEPKPDDPPVEASLTAIIDRTPATAEVLLPPENGLACLVPAGNAEALGVRALARDVSPKLEIEGAALRPDGGPWSPMRRLCSGPACGEPFVTRGVPADLEWDVAGTPGGEHEARVSFCDRAGSRTTVHRRLTLTRAVRPRVVSVSPVPFSPNGDGRLDTVDVTFRLAEATLLSATVHQGSAGGPLVRSLFSGRFQLAGDVSVAWNGLRDDGQAAVDGPYAIVLSAENGCATTGEASSEVEVDRTPPAVGLVEPTTGQRVRATVDVRGHATDDHLALWRLEAACGVPEPTLVATNVHRIEPEGTIAAWDTSRAPTGPCTLRLAAEDRAQNRAETGVAVEVESGGFIRQLAASPDLLSPNGDGRRETTLLRYALHRPARVRLQVRHAGGSAVRTLVDAEVRDAGDHELAWDGRDAAGGGVPDGDYVAWLRAESPDQPEVYEEQTIRLVVDATPPAVAVSRPSAGSYVPADARVRASIADAHLREYVLIVTPGGGPAVEIARGSQARSDEALASLARFSDGPHTLSLTASDQAENESQLTLAFSIDSSPPEAAIAAPAHGSVLARGDEPIPVTGRVEDANPGSWTLRFGAGPEPAAFGSIGSGTSTGPALALGSWDVRSVPDGPYVLSLVATDQASLSAESRVGVTLDGTPPKVALGSPAEGAYVTAPGPIRGSVSDATLASWLVEAAPCPAAGAFQWEPVVSGTAAVEDGHLGPWDPLPPDGPYTLRLTGRDQVGLEASTRVSVVVDTTPPATPTGLAAQVARASDTHGRVRVSWNANTEPDLAGYVVRRDEAELHEGTREPVAWDDGERVEGTYVYSVLAVDRAGNRGQPARLRVRVDVTPPAVSFSGPAEAAFVSGAVEVRGTAYSADDFAEYRLLVGAGEEPAAWTLLQRSTLPVAAGRLGDWLALSNGPYRLALEAEDASGNSARVTRRVDVDTAPPEPPVLVSVARGPAPADWLRPEWEPSPSPDVAGTLVYRNGRLANAASLVLGDLVAYLVPGQAWDDRGLPDGEHCYHVVAMDGAGNVSLPSGEKCQSLDNRAPRAVVVQPADGSRFGEAALVVASAADLDVARVRLELRAEADTQWRPFGEVAWLDGQPIPRWEATLDPAALALAPGLLQLRAVATDRSGNTDPDPPAITVTYGDTTPPPEPLDLVVRVDGTDALLEWTPASAPDLESYRLYRDGQRVAEGLTEPRHTDAGLSPGTYEYAVSAVDGDGNEGATSLPAGAVVYALRLDEPAWPLAAGTTAALSGEGARAETTVSVLREGEPVASASAAGGAFRVESVPLAPGGNVLAARGEDAAGNRSILSNEIVLISNDPPGPVTDLAAAVDGHGVALAWAPVADADLHGYVVRRDGRRVTRTIAREDAAAVEASLEPQAAASAFDRDPDTAWPSAAATGEWTVRFAAPVLVESVRVRFAGAPDVAASYTVLAQWEGRDLPIARARGNARLVAEHRLPSAFATASLRVSLESPGRLAEVAIDGLDVTPAGTTAFTEAGVPDGRHRYEVTAIDRYGSEGEAAVAEAGVGDVLPPGRPAGLVAVPEVRDVALTWNPNPEPDIAGYVVLRDGARIATVPAPAHRDRGLANGTYAYTVIAVDRAGLESGESDPASATIAVLPSPPGPPVILEPTDAAHPITLASPLSDVGGRADAGTTVEVEVDGVVRGAAPVRPGFAFAGRVELPEVAAPTLSPDGRLVAWTDYWGPIVVRGLPGGDRTFEHGGTTVLGDLVFSPDGGRLAFGRYVSGFGPDLAVLDLADGSVRRLTVGEPSVIAWAPDAARLAVGRSEAAETILETVDAVSGAVSLIGRTSGSVRWLRWSPDGSRLASLRAWSGGAAELRLDVPGTGESLIVDAQPWPDAPPAWSPDGDRLAWTTTATGGRHLRLFDVRRGEPAGEVGEAGADVVDPRFSPDGSWLSYVRVRLAAEGETLRSVVARRLESGLVTTVSGPRVSQAWPEDHEWRQGSLSLRDGLALETWSPEAGRFLVPGVPLSPGENLLVARATDPATGLTGADSAPVLVTVLAESFPDFAVTPVGILPVPGIPLAGSPMRFRVRVDNRGATDADASDLAVRVLGPTGSAALDTNVDLPGIEPGSAAWLTVAWTPATPGRYVVSVVADAGERVAESDESNNSAERTVVVVADTGLSAEIGSDRASYPAGASASVTVTLANPGRLFEGVARTTVEELDGREVALLDERPVSLDYGETVEHALAWTTGTTRASRYAFRVRVRPTGVAADTATAERVFDVEPGLAVLARVRPEPATVGEGAPVSFALLARNQGTNAPLDGALARLRVQLKGAAGPARFETVRALPTILPGGTWEAADPWEAAGPAGRYAVVFEIEHGGAVLASAPAVLTVAPASAEIHGTVSVSPGDVLAGQASEARVTVENRGAASASGYPLLVDVVSGAEATVHFSAPATVDLDPGQSRSLVLTIETAAVPPGRHVVRLRAGASPFTLDRSSLVVHGLVAPPSPHLPADGARVPTAHPALVVNNASSPDGAALAYEFQLFSDELLTQPLPGATGIAETPSRTAWPVLARLAEDTEYWWRARATDGFSTSAWSAVTSFTVDAVNRPPTAPLPDTPVPGSRVASRQPLLTVRNALDPEGQPLTYEFRLGTDEGVTQVVAAQSGVAEGLGFTAWDPGAVLDEDALYHWTARARTAGDAPEDFSPWSEPVSFRVDAVNEPPTAPRPLRPVDGVAVATHAPALVVENATDPEGEPLAYRFEIDTRPTLDSPARQVSPELPGGVAETSWSPPVSLDENTVHYWRAHASDGFAETPSPLASFVVNVANEAPSAPVAIDPVDGRPVGTNTPPLAWRNAADPDGDVLTYEIEVRDAAGAVVASATGIPSGVDETAWTVATALAENQAFTWSARASDGELQGPWSAPAAFRVDAVVEPPSAPVPLLPADGAVVEERRPALVVENATSPDGLALTYSFELEAVAADGSTSPVAQVEGVAETEDATAWPLPVDLGDGDYQWRARARDPRASGPWSATARFAVLVDPPPAAPLGLRALAGDARVRLDWNASSEPDANGYRVYRSTTAGGPHDFVSAVAAPGLDDLGLTNGVTYFYVVTATDARAESGYSNEAAARPEAPAALVAEVRYHPAVIRGECLLPGRRGHRDARDRRLWRGAEAGGGAPEAFDGPTCRRENECPEWLYATLEMPPAHDPATIDALSLRLFGSVAADPGYRATVDVDHDGLPELRVRFDFDRVVPHLSVGVQPATIVGRAAGVEVRGTGPIEVLPLGAQLRVTPRTLQRRSCGEDVLATLTFAEGLSASAVDVATVRLNGVVPVERVVRACGRELKVKFDRGAAIAVLPVGSRVEVRVTGTLRGVPFTGVDHIRVME